MSDLLKTSRDPAHPSMRLVASFVASLWVRRRTRFLLGTVLMLGATGFDLLMPMAAARLVDSLTGLTRGDTQIWMAWGILVGAFAFAAVLRNASIRMWVPVSATNMEALVNETYTRVQQYTPEWHAEQLSGTTVRQISRGMWGYDSVSDAVCMRLGPTLLVLVGLCASLAWRLPHAGACSFALVGLFSLVSVLASSWYLRPTNLKASTADSTISGLLADVLSGHATVRAFATEKREAARVAEAMTEWRLAAITSWCRSVNLGLVQSALLWLLLAGVTAATVHAWNHEHATAGDVAFAVTAFLQMSIYLRNIGDNVRAMQKGIDDLAGLIGLVQNRDAMPARHKAHPADAASCNIGGDLHFENVSFGYPGRPPVLRGLNLHVRAGETVLIVGASGSGKSTLIRLLQGIYEPQRGRVKVGGFDTTSVSSATLRQAISAVSQDTALLHRSIHENVAYGRPDATRADVVAAAVAASADTFISALPNGYDSAIGQHDSGLSGGQLQRIALARALLTNASILVLDEATSALDRSTEEDILERLAADRGRQTRVVISHRPSETLRADRVLRLVDGSLIDVSRTDAAESSDEMDSDTRDVSVAS
ncbi:ABC transporter ATP-binding protein [Paraburkholderia sediminicola]|uniref:ABC transporter ATP-binding protein n=1 Tax=Paraburkholderia sediminicola TaxID=458836 RepID=UPI0038BB5561